MCSMCNMKNITLALDEKILTKTREIAAKRGTSLNGLIRSFLERICGESETLPDDDWLEEIFKSLDRKLKPIKINWTRDDIHRF